MAPAAKAQEARVLKRIGSFLICLFLLIPLCAGYVVLHASTFQGELMPTWTHGSFDMDHGNYQDFLKAADLGAIHHLDKANKHPLVAVTYHLLGNQVYKHTKNVVVPCSLLVGLALLIYGLWLYWRTNTVYALIGVVLMGSSFAVWFNGSVLEARSAIFLGVVILLVGLDLVNKYPGFPATVAAAVLTVPLLGFCVANMFLLPLVPAMLVLKRKRLGMEKVFRLILFYLLLILFFLAAGFHLLSKANPGISLNEFIRISKYESGKNNRCETSHLTVENFKMTIRQYFFCSLAGLPQPPTPQPGKLGGVKDSLWLRPNLLQMYIATASGALFVTVYGVVLLTLVILTVRRKYEGHLFWILLIWLGIDIFFFTYFDPWARSPWGVEIMAPIWTIIILGVFKFKPRLWWLLLIFAAILLWHNATVMRYLRELY